MEYIGCTVTPRIKVSLELGKSIKVSERLNKDWNATELSYQIFRCQSIAAAYVV